MSDRILVNIYFRFQTILTSFERTCIVISKFTIHLPAVNDRNVWSWFPLQGKTWFKYFNMLPIQHTSVKLTHILSITAMQKYMIQLELS
jgi:hypothetical protein